MNPPATEHQIPDIALAASPTNGTTDEVAVVETVPTAAAVPKPAVCKLSISTQQVRVNTLLTVITLVCAGRTVLTVIAYPEMVTMPVSVIFGGIIGLAPVA